MGKKKRYTKSLICCSMSGPRSTFLLLPWTCCSLLPYKGPAITATHIFSAQNRFTVPLAFSPLISLPSSRLLRTLMLEKFLPAWHAAPLRNSDEWTLLLWAVKYPSFFWSSSGRLPVLMQMSSALFWVKVVLHRYLGPFVDAFGSHSNYFSRAQRRVVRFLWVVFMFLVQRTCQTASRLKLTMEILK